VIDPGRDKNDIPQPQPLGLETVELASLDDTPAELVLLAVAPDIDAAGGGESQDVVCAARYGGELDFGEGRERDGSELERWMSGDAVEAENTIVRLC